MDVPFSSSGALSRRHYALVRSIESRTTVQEGDRYLRAEIQSIRSSLTSPDLTPALCKECLVILLYCFNMIENDFTPGLLDFALPHAATLAETGTTTEQKRIGYSFCSEIMRSDNELQLMLINTVRKDLDSSSVARMCLALESGIALPSLYLAPAVLPRISELLTHNSPQIRRRAIHAYRILGSNSLFPPAVLLKRLNDPDDAVIDAALSVVSSPIFQSSVGAEQLVKIKAVVHGLAFDDGNEDQPCRRRALLTLSAIEPLDQDRIAELCEYAHHSGKNRDLSMLWTSFHLLSQYSIEQLKLNIRESPVSYIRDLLASDDANLHYLFLTCLNSIDPIFWAGSTGAFPNVLEASEIEKIMQFIDSPDPCIRIKILQVLKAVDPNILQGVYARLLQAFSHEANIRARNEYTIRLLEVMNAKTADNGEMYAQMVMELLSSVDSSLDTMPISEVAIEKILSRVQYASRTFQIQCAVSLITPVAEEQLKLGPTVIVVIAALVAQYSTHILVSLSAILSGLASHLPGAPSPVQDACILAMLWLAADCEVPDEVQAIIARVHDKAGRHIRKRCKQFSALFQEKAILQYIIKGSPSNTLPEFSQLLESYEAEITQGTRPGHKNSATKLNELPGSKLRYDTYEAPRATSKLRVSKQAGARERPATDQNNWVQTNGPPPTVDDSMSRVDLIAFDQPIASLGSKSTFISVWKSMENSDYNVRGWSEKTVPDLIRKLEASENMTFEMMPEDEEPFCGEATLIITMGPEDIVALKLRKSDEDGTLWRLRTEKAELGKELKELLT